MGYPGDNDSGRGPSGSAHERTSRYQSARHDTGVTDSSPLSQPAPRRKSGGGPARPEKRGSTRRSSALNGLPITLPPPLKSEGDGRASGSRPAATSNEERGPIAMGAPVNSARQTQPHEEVPRRRSSGITRNLRRTGRAQKAVVADKIETGRPGSSRPSGQRLSTKPRPMGRSSISSSQRKVPPPERVSSPSHRQVPPPERLASPPTDDKALNLKPPRRLGSARYSAVLKNRSSILGGRRPAAAAPAAAPDRFESGKQPQAPIPAPTGRTSRHGSQRPEPSRDFEWQILTSGGATIPCDGIDELRRWKHTRMAVVGVSYRGQAWRDWKDFRAVLRTGASGQDAFKSAGPI